ncbi:MAG: 50S ribosomal protein L20 [Candidatus Cloacimonetes bacterium]|jgi:large subunit ribosomal protein L20|nr:50S ribosomal protein L20 [Candidatus Cloacimonadota bacterium]MBT6993627.1 50S ribosomal protein L20 [Candidatus Cloacimonadota bacterium]MBT7470082.1 50S ribosomal protein L20 [Candidatus Cloacimonadota bacterium]
MPRSTNNVAAKRRRKKYLRAAKGYVGGRSKLYRTARQAVEKGWLYAYRDRRTKKREIRKLWIIRINAAARMHELSYSRFISGLKKLNVEINRKALAHLAFHDMDAFKAFCDLVKNQK